MLVIKKFNFCLLLLAVCSTINVANGKTAEQCYMAWRACTSFCPHTAIAGLACVAACGGALAVCLTACDAICTLPRSSSFHPFTCGYLQHTIDQSYTKRRQLSCEKNFKLKWDIALMTTNKRLNQWCHYNGGLRSPGPLMGNCN